MRPSESRITRPASRAVTGIVLLDKPPGLSSNRALQTTKRLFRADKAGHTGSLDPLASGLLPICFGEATKIAGLLLGSRKTYMVQCQLGITTTTEDAEGEVLERRSIPPLDDATLHTAASAFVGHITQVVPVYSALKRDGVPLYRRARRGEDVVAPAREVDVYRFDLLEHVGDRLRLLVECGSGTYVRSLVRDLGERLGCGAHVTALRRLSVEPFSDPDMLGLDELVALAEADPAALDARLLPLERGLVGYPQVCLDAVAAARLRSGQIAQPASRILAAGPCVAIDATGRAIAMVQVDHDGRLRPQRVFNWS